MSLLNGPNIPFELPSRVHITSPKNQVNTKFRRAAEFPFEFITHYHRQSVQETHTENLICMYELYWRVFLAALVKDEQSRTGQKEKLNCEKVSTENFFWSFTTFELNNFSGLSPFEVVVLLYIFESEMSLIDGEYLGQGSLLVLNHSLFSVLFAFSYFMYWVYSMRNSWSKILIDLLPKKTFPLLLASTLGFAHLDSLPTDCDPELHLRTIWAPSHCVSYVLWLLHLLIFCHDGAGRYQKTLQWFTQVAVIMAMVYWHLFLFPMTRWIMHARVVLLFLACRSLHPRSLK